MAKNDRLAYFANVRLTGLIRDYKSNESKIKEGKNKGKTWITDTFSIVSGENNIVVSRGYTEDNLYYEKDGSREKTYLARDIEKIKKASKDEDTSLFTITAYPWYRTYMQDGEEKVSTTATFHGFPKFPDKNESCTFVVRGIVENIKKNIKKDVYEVTLGFIERGKDDSYLKYQWFSVYVPTELLEEHKDIIARGNYVSMAGNVFSCYNVDEFNHADGNSKRGYYVAKVYPKEFIEKDDLPEEEVDLYKKVKKEKFIDNREETKSTTKSTTKKAVRSFDDKLEEDEEDDI